MNRRHFIKSASLLLAQGATLNNTGLLWARVPEGHASGTQLHNPYAAIDWQQIQRHKAALHFHTLQSDGGHLVDDVIIWYRRAGFSILSITDHDTMEPNRQVKPSGAARIAREAASPFPRKPLPENFPAQPTWPWTDYGCSSPQNLGLIGIEGNELSCRLRHHINSYYNDSGWRGQAEYNSTGWYADVAEVPDRAKDVEWEDFQLYDVAAKGGLAVICHPGWSPQWHRKSLDWYVERYQKHDFSYLPGIEITNHNREEEDYDFGLWDQLLARFMPYRPIWGFGADDMHFLNDSRQTFNLFLLPELNDTTTRHAMESGCFFVCRSTRKIDYRVGEFNGHDPFPEIEAIQHDPENTTLAIQARGYDEIRWITAPESLEPIADYKTSNRPWPLGKVAHKGDSLNYRTTPGLKKYVRAELHRWDGNEVHSLFTNPFALFKS